MLAISGNGKRLGVKVSAFTLIELMVVVTIIGLLMALLVPGLTAAWETAQMTRCKTNLLRIFQAQALWRSERGDQLLMGSSWNGELLPYVEWDKGIFQCQTRASWGYSGHATDGSSGGSSGGSGGGSGSDGGSGGDGSGSGDDGSGAWYPKSDEIEAAFEFDVYLQQGATGTTPGCESWTHEYGEFIWSIPLGGHAWVRKEDHGSYTTYYLDDCARGNTQKDDLEVDIHYADGQPTKVVVKRASGADSWSVTGRFMFDFKMCGEVIIKNWPEHYGETIELQPPENWSGDPNRPTDGDASDGGWGRSGSLTGGFVWNGSAWVPRRAVPFLMGDYAISRGAYERSDGSFAATLDAKLFFILDFGGQKTVADFNGGVDEDAWDLYFIDTTKPGAVEDWQRKFGADYTDWKAYQALRHTGTANVMFCDGHVESLTGDELYYLNPLWRYQGR